MSDLTSRVETDVERTVDLSKSLIMVALVITAALAWNDSIGLIIKATVGPALKNQGMYHLGFAVLVTLVVVILSESFDMEARLPIHEGLTSFQIDEQHALGAAEKAEIDAVLKEQYLRNCKSCNKLCKQMGCEREAVSDRKPRLLLPLTENKGPVQWRSW